MYGAKEEVGAGKGISTSLVLSRGGGDERKARDESEG